MYYDIPNLAMLRSNALFSVATNFHQFKLKLTTV